ncbi:MAG: FAD:protein FMN transferase, partial [Nitrospinae bacterium]|nr:FAD:protein FMN transferase [Nitrospinota bacterium]
AEVVRRGIHWSELSAGAMDITIGPAVALWNFDVETASPPDAKALEEAVRLIHYQDISIGNGTLQLNRKGMSLHLGAMGKGYAVDRAVDVLKKFGIENGLVNAGGDLMAFGTRDDRQDGTQAWRIGLQHPRSPEKMIASLDLSDRAVATSGDYQRYFIRDGIRYHHILDPQTGLPARSAMSATVVASSATDADALATALFVLGPDRGIALIDSLDGVEGMILSASGDAHFSSGFRNLPGFSFKGL